jgi:hypothetical protein
MKKLFTLCLFFTCAYCANAQTDTTLNEYTGKFKFPDGSPFTEITIAVTDGTLMASSSIGTAEFKKTDTKDVFEIMTFGGLATYKRNADGKITSLRIQVQDLDIEGTKSEGKLHQFIHADRLLPAGRESFDIAAVFF